MFLKLVFIVYLSKNVTYVDSWSQKLLYELSYNQSTNILE